MFNLANIFGIGKSETENPSSPNLNDDNHSSSSSTSDSTAYSENDLGDWILIDPEIKKKNQPAVAAVTAAEEFAVKQIRKSKKNSRGNKPSLEKVQSLEESSWHIDPPECFKASPEASQVQTSSSLENLLIEIPNMSVFDNFFTKKIFIVKEEPKLKKPNPLELTKKTSANGAKENANPASARSNKKKQLEIAVNVLPVFNQKNKGTSFDQMLIIRFKMGDKCSQAIAISTISISSMCLKTVPNDVVVNLGHWKGAGVKLKLQ